MHTWVEINEKNLIKNYQTFSGLCGKTPVMPILKSNAYGHGLTKIAAALIPQNPKWIGVNSVAEGFALRNTMYQGNILVMGPILTREELSLSHSQHLDITIGSFEILNLWLNLKNKPNIHLKVDTGMSRQGFLPTTFPQALSQILHTDYIFIRGIYTHFADVEDSMDTSWAHTQLHSLLDLTNKFHKQGLKPLIHSAATAAALVIPNTRLDITRIGIGLYGLWPGSQMPDSPLRSQLKPVLSWRARLTTVKHIEDGSYVGYGCHYKTRRATDIAVIPVGYYEGYPRLASSGDVLIHGKRCSILGRICMNMMMVDVTDLPERAKPGDTATLLGKDEKEEILAEDIATRAQSIHYEIITRINSALPRISTQSEKPASPAYLELQPTLP
ncbi:MAG: alanine racemase [Oligoflexales bacterium]